MGVVYAAYDANLDRRVALKVLREETLIAEDPTAARSRLLREAQALARLSHPNVVAVHDAVVHEHTLFVTMEFIDGVTLRQWQEQPRKWQEVLEVYGHAARGLAAAHTAGLVHRDFKPENVLVDHQGRVRVMDFGLARPVSAPARDSSPAEAEEGARVTDVAQSLRLLDTPLTLHGSLMGTPAYMAPEQIRGCPTDARTDQFSFCVALYEALFGRRPFEGATLSALTTAMKRGPLPPAKQSPVPDAIRSALARGLSEAPNDRHASMEALLHLLLPKPRSNRTLAWAIAGAAILIGSTTTLLAWRNRQTASSMCNDPDRAFAQIWDGPRKHALREAFARSGNAFARSQWKRVEASLDNYTRDWSTMHKQACEATHVRGEQSDRILDLRMFCLDRRVHRIRSLTDAWLQEGEKSAAHALEAVISLPPVSDCGNMQDLLARVPLPEDPTVRAKVQTLQRKLAGTDALFEAGRYAQVLESAEATVREARETRHDATTGEALLLLGKVQDKLGKYDQALSSYSAAAEHSATSNNTDSFAQSLVGIANIVSYRGDRKEEASRWIQVASAVARRGGDETQLVASVELSQAAFARALRQRDQAAVHVKRALEIGKKVFPPEHLFFARVQVQLAHNASDAGHPDDALVHLSNALALREQTLGADHPSVADTLQSLGIAHRTLGHYDQALEMYQRALTITEAALGKQHSRYAAVLNSIAIVASRKGAWDQALDYHRQVLQIRIAAFGKDHHLVADSYHNTAIVLWHRKRFADALTAIEESIRIHENLRRNEAIDMSSVLAMRGTIQRDLGHPKLALADHEQAVALVLQDKGPNHPSLAYPLLSLGRTLVSLQRVSEARARLEAALVILQAHNQDVDPVDLALVQSTLAQTLDDTPAQQARALDLATHARTTFAKSGPASVEDLATVDQWLAKHPRP
jgi:tetratricopeptide (TPR) repeat protein/predicted Ser/Thr protein kinase